MVPPCFWTCQDPLKSISPTPLLTSERPGTGSCVLGPASQDRVLPCKSGGGPASVFITHPRDCGDRPARGKAQRMLRGRDGAPPLSAIPGGGRLAESRAHCTQNEEREHSEALGDSTFFLNGHHGGKPALCRTQLRREAEQDLLAFALLSLKPSEEEDEQE